MLTVKTYLAPSRVHGIGVFLLYSAKAGETLWIFEPAIDREITRLELERLPAVARDAALARSFIIRETGEIILSRDQAVFINHSETPNLGNDGRALRDIGAGEELTEDYRQHGEGACRAFLDGDRSA